MQDSVLKQAKAWGFVCEEDHQGTWQISPQQIKERWRMRLVEDRWLLIVGDTPQVHLYSHEAITFLERHRC